MSQLKSHLVQPYNRAIATAYQLPKGTTFTTADLFSGFKHSLTPGEQISLGGRFCSLAKKRPRDFAIVGKKGTRYIYKKL